LHRALIDVALLLHLAADFERARERRTKQGSMSELEATDVSPQQRNEAVGARLRSIRRQQGLSLEDVQARSGTEFKASVLGAYERGERAISVPRLLRLAQLYGVPPDQFLAAPWTRSRTTRTEEGFAVDLERLASAEASEAAVLRRLVERVQIQRQDFTGRVFTIRSDDMGLLATVLGRSQDELEQQLEQLGLRANVAES
jgi:transcriptional regulator with XRE-family HTH domain